jgi:6-pyruvoyltetrahydropterin/6-carboxytetrahydropterin synthase
MRMFTFAAGHRILGHEGRCKHLHGHTYTAEVTVRALDDSLDDLGRVLDFAAVKGLVGGWIEEYWDHNLILPEADPLWQVWEVDKGVFEGRKPYRMRLGNPTAEHMARELATVANGLLAVAGCRVTHVRIWETPNCCADYEPEPEVIR